MQGEGWMSVVASQVPKGKAPGATIIVVERTVWHPGHPPVRDELMTGCIELNMAGFEAGGIPTPVAYTYAKELCTALFF